MSEEGGVLDEESDAGVCDAWTTTHIDILE